MSASARHGAPRALLVDDAPDIRMIARVGLERIGGWEVVAVDSGEAALAVLESDLEPFDVVLLDVMMPGLDGPSTLARVRDGTRAPEVPVVFLTAKAEASERARLLALGAAGVIAKPFDPLTLSGQLARILDHRSSSTGGLDDD